jgi:hypothetical protein
MAAADLYSTRLRANYVGILIRIGTSVIAMRLGTLSLSRSLHGDIRRLAACACLDVSMTQHYGRCWAWPLESLFSSRSIRCRMASRDAT